MTLLVTGLQLDCATGHSPLSSASQPGLNPPHYPLIQPTFPEIAYEDIFGAYVKGLAGMHVDIHCSSLIYPGSCATAEGDQVSSASFHFGESHADYLFLFHMHVKSTYPFILSTTIFPHMPFQISQATLRTL